jgi:hypothetical protein
LTVPKARVANGQFVGASFATMSCREALPEDCPPEAAEEIAAARDASNKPGGRRITPDGH